ncbi:unnamed protein product [Mucor hiemalis]
MQATRENAIQQGVITSNILAENGARVLAESLQASESDQEIEDEVFDVEDNVFDEKLKRAAMRLKDQIFLNTLWTYFQSESGMILNQLLII